MYNLIMADIAAEASLC